MTTSFLICNLIFPSKNKILNRFAERSKEDWGVGVDLTHDDLVSQSVTKYNNMVKQDRWKVQELNNSKIMALITQITNLEKQSMITVGPRLYYLQKDHPRTLT